MEQQSIFSTENDANQPLAARLRPQTLEEFVGQRHLLGPGKVLRRLIESDNIPSMIFWGPPGVGKTTLARIIAHRTRAEFIDFSAVTSGIREIREVMQQAEANRRFGGRTIVFVDEIHRFNKAQQDAFLPFVEKGSILLIGATTENPSFEINGALLSRCKVFVLQALGADDLAALVRRALADPRGFGGQRVEIPPELPEVIARFANGDARAALSTLEMVVLNADYTYIYSARDGGDARAVHVAQIAAVRQERRGALQPHLRAAQVHAQFRSDAAVYWLARMLESGEDPMYIARRVTRFASEDVGLADPRALEIAVAASQACHLIGMPECSVHLTEAVVYMSLAPKSNALYAAYETAKKDALEQLAEPVPLVIRNAPTKLMAQLDCGKGYQYAHDAADRLTNMQCLPDSLRDRVYYRPTEEGVEGRWKARLEEIKEWKRRHAND